jgi:hypothetical protein
MKLKHSRLLLLFLALAALPFQSAFAQDDDFKFDFKPGKMRSKKSGSFEATLFWGFGPTIVTSNNEVSGTYYPEFKPFSSWSNDLGILGKLRLGGAESKMYLNTGLLWRYLNVETDDGALGLEDGNPVYFEFPEARNTELNVHTLSIPLLFEYRSRFAFALGGFMAYRLGSSSEVDTKVNGNRVKAKVYADFGLNDLLYGVTAQVGGKRARLYVNYYLNSLYKESTPYDFSVLNIGICLQ